MQHIVSQRSGTPYPCQLTLDSSQMSRPKNTRSLYSNLSALLRQSFVKPWHWQHVRSKGTLTIQTLNIWKRDLGEIYSLFLTDKEYMDELICFNISAPQRKVLHGTRSLTGKHSRLFGCNSPNSENGEMASHIFTKSQRNIMRKRGTYWNKPTLSPNHILNP